MPPIACLYTQNLQRDSWRGTRCSHLGEIEGVTLRCSSGAGEVRGGERRGQKGFHLAVCGSIGGVFDVYLVDTVIKNPISIDSPRHTPSVSGDRRATTAKPAPGHSRDMRSAQIGACGLRGSCVHAASRSRRAAAPERDVARAAATAGAATNQGEGLLREPCTADLEHLHGKEVPINTFSSKKPFVGKVHC